MFTDSGSGAKYGTVLSYTPSKKSRRLFADHILHNEENYDHFCAEFPRGPEVRKCDEWGPPWIHHDGDEYLVANPVEVPSLACLLKSCYGRTVRYNGTIILDDVNKGVFYWKEKGVEKVDVFSDTADPTNVDRLTLS